MKRYLAIAFTTFAICTMLAIVIEVDVLRLGEPHSRPWLGLGDAYKDKGNFAAAMECYTMAANLAPTRHFEHAKGLATLSGLCGMAGQLGRSKVYAEESMKMWPNKVAADNLKRANYEIWKRRRTL